MSTKKIILGTDPELVFVGPKGIISARDDCGLPRQIPGGNNPEMGADGHPHIAEIRPHQDTSPVQLVENIRLIMERHKKEVPKSAVWRAGSWVEGKPIGGHIHFSGALPLTDPLITGLDGVLAQMIILIEDTNEARKRRAGAYGRLADVRNKNWGFEYRTLPSFILSPPITLGVFALAKAVAYEEMMEGPHSVQKLKPGALKAIMHIEDIPFRNADRAYFLPRIETFWDKAVRKYLYWRTNEGKILWKNASLLRHIARKHPNWHNGRGLLHRWGIVQETPKEQYKESVMKPLLAHSDPLAPGIAYSQIFKNIKEMM